MLVGKRIQRKFGKVLYEGAVEARVGFQTTTTEWRAAGSTEIANPSRVNVFRIKYSDGGIEELALADLLRFVVSADAPKPEAAPDDFDEI